MLTIPVELPDELQEFVEAKVQLGQFADANEYIVALVDAARRNVMIKLDIKSIAELTKFAIKHGLASLD